MAVVGSLGGVVFSVSRRTFKTFDGMKRETGARYSTHNRHLKRPLLEYLGPDLESVNFSLILSAFLGVDPESALARLRRMTQDGQAERLILGNRVYGSYKWVIEKLSQDLQRFDNRGRLLAAKCTVSLKEYAKR